MARPRSFDEAETLACAMTAFWRAGFEATTYRGLAKETGVGLRSLHNAFGEKDALFARTLDAYTEMAAGLLDQVLSPPSPDALIGLFEATAAPVPEGDVRRSGCLMANTAFELSAPPAAVAERIAAYRTLFTDRFEACLAAGGVADPAPKAEFLLGALWGMLGQIRLAGDTTSAAPMAGVVADTIRGWTR
ncbi:TetR/AcrR family transcriptional regulator [Jannaschia sp. Os4]|uniref:TetR/AcrR family transcriptional regulator n=1 Tax=Jannaschia sp. Os4 TaxID=2807617 RepID=UPI00193AD7BF|nr:TetR/AcrR family transcriptional regulator [Jannaschia sp. Os4]MBM2577249.1 TetR/AcrR family transcriptional regulator [Jannaschia sp. Os4]